jgi:hypothetical protein
MLALLLLKWTRLNLEHKDYPTIYGPKHHNSHAITLRRGRRPRTHVLETRFLPERGQQTPREKRPPSSSASQIAPISLPPRSSLPWPSLLQRTHEHAPHTSSSCPWDMAAPATKLMRLHLPLDLNTSTNLYTSMHPNYLLDLS